MLANKTRIRQPAKRAGSSAAKPRKQPSQARSRETVAIILEAAARVLETAGLEGYNTNAVAAKAGVSIGSLYQYFPGKDALTVALILNFERDLQQSVQTAAAAVEKQPLQQALRHIVRQLYAAHLRRARLHVLLEAEEQRLRRHIPKDSDALAQMVRKLLRRYQADLRVPIKHAVHDCITISVAMIDEALQNGTPAAAAERRTVQALCGYLLWKA